MSRHEKVIEHILSGESDANIDFDDLRGVLLRKGFRERVKGSHHIFTSPGVRQRVTLQPDGRHAKAYQVRQIRELLAEYRQL